MDNYIVRRPIINNASQKVEAYEVVLQENSSSLYHQGKEDESSPILSFFSQVNMKKFLGGKNAFLTFTPDLLMRDIPCIFNEKKLVIQIEDNVLLHPKTIESIKQYHDHGYRLALIGFEFYNRYLEILPNIEYLKIDFSEPFRDSKKISNVIRIAKKLNKKTIACNVNTAEDRGKALVYGFNYVQGESVADMIRKSKVHQMEKLNSIFYRLVAAVTCEQPDFNEIERLVSMDVSLTFSLLNMVNSAYFARPNRIKDVKQALTTLGLGQLKQWIYLMSFVPDGGMTEELVKTSFLRAIFCQKLAGLAPSLAFSGEDAYLIGMFSTLGALLNIPQEDAIKPLPISNKIKDVLIGRSNPGNKLLELCVAYEKGRWTKMGSCAKQLGIPLYVIATEYFSSIEYVNEIWKNLLRPTDV